MGAQVEFARYTLRNAAEQFAAHVEGISLEEALYSAGGYRSVLGAVKHAAAWAHVYHSYAFEAEPLHWDRTSWPRGLIDTIETSAGYLDEITDWHGEAFAAWDANVAALADSEMAAPRPLHWGGTAPLAVIVHMVCQHTTYHTGEINMLLSVARGHAWEYTEEVEENHLPSLGHGVRAGWMTGAQAAAYEERLRQRAIELGNA
jgi:uncharacterized damage-inducible protein DinB